jgi:cation transport ATPase
VALTAAAVWFRVWELFSHVSVVGTAATLIGGSPIFKEAFENIIERKMMMELSMTIALLSALAIGEFFTDTRDLEELQVIYDAPQCALPKGGTLKVDKLDRLPLLHIHRNQSKVRTTLHSIP